jgi:hypothetical protein
MEHQKLWIRWRRITLLALTQVPSIFSKESQVPSKAAAVAAAGHTSQRRWWPRKVDVGGELASRGGRSGFVSPHLPQLGFPSSLPPPPPPNRSSGGAMVDLGRGERDRRAPQGSGHNPAGAVGGGCAGLNTKGAAGAHQSERFWM